MRPRTIVLLALVLLVTLLPAASAGRNGPGFYLVDPLVYEAQGHLDPLDPYCGQILAAGQEAGMMGNESQNDTRIGNEWDPLARQNNCVDLRDQAQYDSGFRIPETYGCRSMYGENCVGTRHWWCDVGVVVGSGLVYLCMGGFDPYN